jgi:fatty-acyl-CoA synthase
VVLVPRLDPAEALGLIEGERITHLMGVPTIFQMLADHPRFDAADLRCVRDALCGGAPLALPLFLRYRARGIPLRQGFGLTEVGPNCFSMPGASALAKMQGDPNDPTAGPPGSCVGRPIHHIDARVLRPDGSDCAPGEPGELVLGGPVVFGGYLDEEGATARSMVEGYFRTGDVLSVDRDGFFFVRGRLKEMYKSGGENVYPAEVEATLLQCPGVGQVAVIGVADARWGEVGWAFVEAAPGVSLDAAEIGPWLQGRLARFKQPKRILCLPSLPRTGSGKIDKNALRARSLED